MTYYSSLNFLLLNSLLTLPHKFQDFFFKLCLEHVLEMPVVSAIVNDG